MEDGEKERALTACSLSCVQPRTFESLASSSGVPVVVGCSGGQRSSALVVSAPERARRPSVVETVVA